MSKPTLLIKDIEVFKMPSFPRGMAALNGFARNINIIAGPNASGKSSTARLIRQLLWRQQLERLHADCRLEIAGSNWDIHAESGYYSCQRDGQVDILPSLPAVDESTRYLLALHELVGEKDADLARLLTKEASGGYDLQSALQKLGYDGRTKPRTVNEFKQLELAKGKVAAIETRQKQLKDKEDTLQSLIKAKEDAAAALNYQDLYACVIASIDARDTFDQLDLQYNASPKQLRKLTGKEYQDILDLEQDIDDNEQAIETAEGEISKKQARLTTLALPEGGIDRAVLEELQIRVERLLTAEAKLLELEIDISGRELVAAEALKKLAADLKNTDIKPIDLAEVTDLDRFLLEAHQLQSEKQFLETAIRLLKMEQRKAGTDSALLADGIKALLLWSQDSSPVAGIPGWALWTLFGLGVITAVATWLIGWPGLSGIIIMLVFLMFSSRAKNSADSETRKGDFRRTKLTEPASWDTDGVLKRLEELNTALQEVKWLDLIDRQLESQGAALEGLQPKLEKLEKQRGGWLEKIGALPHISEEELKNYSGLYWFLKNLMDWQQCYAELKALQLQRVQAEGQQEDSLTDINLILKDIGEAIADGPEAQGMLRKLQTAENERQRLADGIGGLEGQLEEKNLLKERLAKKLRAIYDDLELSYSEKEMVWSLTEQLDTFKELVKERQRAEFLLSEKQNILSTHSLFAEIEQELDTLVLEQVREKCANFKLQADKLENLNKQIIEIQRDIEREKNGHDLEEALATRDSAIEGLENLYQNNLSSVTGNLLVNQLKEAAREKNQSKVFEQANRLFNRITNGRYELILEEKDIPVFKANDTVLKIGQELSELSTGTRIQLLLSVRLAFIDSQEQNLKLPILADEVLANSDDHRAKEIIRALVEISKDGRQVFYFTAQADEIDKWKTFAETDQELDFKVFTLSGQPNDQTNYRPNEFSSPPSFRINAVPAPGKATAAEYREILKVPTFNLLSEDAEQLHLWYLLDDNALLFECLQKGISRFGQLKSFVQLQGRLSGLNEGLWLSLQLKIKLLESYLDFYRRGRPKAIDRQILVQSGAVTGNFIEQVSARMKEVNNDPQKLIKAMKAGEVSGFRQTKVDELEHYFIAQGILDDQEQLTQEDLQVRLNAVLSNLDLPTAEADAFLIRVIS
jgi:hypothetical protein